MPQTDSPSDVPTYVIDPHLSTFQIHVTAAGLLSAFGHNPTLAVRDFSGTARFSPQSVDSSSLHISARAGSLQVTGNLKDSDRRDIERATRDEVLEAERFPQIEFASESTSPDGNGNGCYTVKGNLTLHGVTQPVTIPVQAALMGDILNASGEFIIRQTDFAIKPVSAVGGGLKVKDDLRVSFHFVARRQSASDA